jgi:hypothetical protein
MKPRVRFCWHCGNKLRGNHFVEVEIEGYPRILHKACEKEAISGGDSILKNVESYKGIFMRIREWDTTNKIDKK